MKKAGCRELLVGFESGSQNLLDMMNKHITLDRSYRFMKDAREAGLDVNGCFVIGLPGETEESAKETIRFALGLGLTTAQFSGAVPYPGTSFYDTARRERWLNASSYSDWLKEGEQTGIVSYPQLSSDRINYYVDLGLKSFYFRPSYIFRFFAVNRSPADLYRKVRGGMNYMSYLFRKR
jgi:anaerobic magnesium-protoporphyrin IX monomethyl ester cyclase